jgi:hypothetical protein
VSGVSAVFGGGCVGSVWCLLSGVLAVFGVCCLVCRRCLVSGVLTVFGVWRCFIPYETSILGGDGGAGLLLVGGTVA